jgi:hypothetical protein
MANISRSGSDDHAAELNKIQRSMGQPSSKLNIPDKPRTKSMADEILRVKGRPIPKYLT